MDREEEQMQFLGVFDIFKESFKIIISYRKIYSQITFILILPLTIIFLADLLISNFLYSYIDYMQFEKAYTTQGTKEFNILSNRLSSEWTSFWLFKTAYLLVFLILYLLSTAAVVYTTTTSVVYTRRDHQLSTFKEVMSVVPIVWKRLMPTFLYEFVAFFVYSLFGILVMIICGVTLPYKEFGAFPLSVFIIIFVMGFVYMVGIWQLASVVTVLEGSASYGLKAMTKANDLIKGKRAVSIWIFFLLTVLLACIKSLFESFVVHGWSLPAWKRVGFGVMCSLLLLSFSLLGLVIQTVLYLVCKSYHHENINKDDLLNHHESYLGEYERVIHENDIPLEQYHV